jgi:hypothetical protein
MLPMTIDAYKRELLYRKAHGNGLRDKHEKKLEFLLGAELESTVSLSLAETDNIIINLVKSQNVFTEHAEFATLDECIKYYSSRATVGEYYLLLDEDWRYCGACIARNLKLNPGYDFNKFRSDEIRLISTDFCTEIAIDYTETHAKDLFECRISRYVPA